MEATDFFNQGQETKYCISAYVVDLWHSLEELVAILFMYNLSIISHFIIQSPHQDSNCTTAALQKTIDCSANTTLPGIENLTYFIPLYILYMSLKLLSSLLALFLLCYSENVLPFETYIYDYFKYKLCYLKKLI